MIRGLSYQEGIFFIGRRHIACAFDEHGKMKHWVKPFEPAAMLLMIRMIITAMPLAFKIISIVFFSLIIVPKLLVLFNIYSGWYGLPWYSIFYYMFGTHFFFPKSLRKYHGAEHKVFSDRGIKSRTRLYRIRKAEITNRYCSTNSVVIYFSAVILGTVVTSWYFPMQEAVMWSSYIAVGIVPIVNILMKYPFFAFLQKYVLTVSYFLQRHITTTEPERKHLLTAIQSYRSLAEVEFPEHLAEKVIPKKEEKRLAIVDITIIPIGTDSPSISSYVADIHQALETYQDRISYQLTPMSTIIEGELPLLFEVIQKIHEIPFQSGVKRVATNIRIDDRRDKPLKMNEKIASVESKLKKEEGTVSEG